MTNERVVRRLAAILAADVAGYSRLMGRDEHGTLTRLKSHRTQRLEPILARHGGRLVKLTGDGALAEFPSAVDALGAAIEFQQAMAEANRHEQEDTRVAFRIGLHLGDLIVDDDDLYGDGVNVAARLEAEAPVGGIVMSGNVHDAVAGRLKASFNDLGSLALKNIERPIQAFGVKWDASDWPATLDTPSSTTVATTPRDEPLALPDKPSIVVLPFQNMSGDPEQEYFTDGITEDIITELSRFRDLFVIARNSSFTYKGKAVDVRDVAREFGVRYVLEGSVRKAGNRVRVTGQLIDALTGVHLWAERYDRLLEDIFDLQEDLTRNIVTAVAPAVRSADFARAARARPADLAAYGLAQKAWSILLRATDGPEQLPRDQAMTLVEAAVTTDPHCVSALNVLAHCHWWNGFYGTAPFEQSLLAGLDACQRALAVETRDNETYLYKGMLLVARREYDPAVSNLTMSFELNPNDARALGWLGWAEVVSGDADQGIAHLLAARRQDPKNPARYLTYVGLSMGCFVKADYVQGLEWATQARSERSDFPPAIHQTMNHLVGLGRLEEAKKDYALLQRISPGYVRTRLEGKSFASFKRPEDGNRSFSFWRLVAGLDDSPT